MIESKRYFKLLQITRVPIDTHERVVGNDLRVTHPVGTVYGVSYVSQFFLI